MFIVRQLDTKQLHFLPDDVFVWVGLFMLRLYLTRRLNRHHPRCDRVEIRRGFLQTATGIFLCGVTLGRYREIFDRS